jgi:hypothetical protein
VDVPWTFKAEMLHENDLLTAFYLRFIGSFVDVATNM